MPKIELDIDSQIEVEAKQIGRPGDLSMRHAGLGRQELQLERIEARRRLAELFLNSARVYALALDLALDPTYIDIDGKLRYKMDPADALELGIKAANAINKGLQVFIPATQSTALKVDMNKAIEAARLDARARLLLISGIDTQMSTCTDEQHNIARQGVDLRQDASDRANAPDPPGTGTDRGTPPSAPSVSPQLQSEMKRFDLPESEKLESNFRRLEYVDEGMRSEIELINRIDSIDDLNLEPDLKVSVGEIDFSLLESQKKIEFGNQKVSEVKSGELISSEGALDNSLPSFNRPKDLGAGKSLANKAEVKVESQEQKHKIDIDLGLLADIYSTSKSFR